MKKIYFTIIVLLLLSCDTKKGEQAEISEAKDIKAPEPETAAATIKYKIRPAASEVSWIGSKPTGKHYGTLGIESGYINIVNEKISGGKIVIDMNDIEVRDLKSDEDSHMKLTEHLRSDDFFDVENHPFAEFELTEIVSYDTIAKTEQEVYERNNTNSFEYELNNPSHKLTGNLTLRDTTLSISFPAYILFSSDQIIAKARFVIDRTLWNVRYNEEAKFTDKAQDQLIYDDVVVGFDILANPEKEVL